MCLFWILKKCFFTTIENPYRQYIIISAITAIIVTESSNRDNWNNLKFIQHKKLQNENKSRLWNRTVKREIFLIEFNSIFQTRWHLQIIFSKLFWFSILLFNFYFDLKCCFSFQRYCISLSLKSLLYVFSALFSYFYFN
jgi:hypothetical protein